MKYRFVNDTIRSRNLSKSFEYTIDIKNMLNSGHKACERYSIILKLDMFQNKPNRSTTMAFLLDKPTHWILYAFNAFLFLEL